MVLFKCTSSELYDVPAYSILTELLYTHLYASPNLALKYSTPSSFELESLIEVISIPLLLSL
jgi:hypothetical protein